MKNFIKLFSSIALLVMFSLALSSYDSVQPVDDPGNGTPVEVVKGQEWYIVTTCGTFYTTKSTSQYKNGELHMRTLIFDYGKDHCELQENAYKMDFEPWTANFTPSGKVIWKIVIN